MSRTGHSVFVKASILRSRRFQRISTTGRLMLRVLIDRADHGSMLARATCRQLGDDIGLRERQVRRLRDRLTEAGCLSWQVTAHRRKSGEVRRVTVWDVGVWRSYRAERSPEGPDEEANSTNRSWVTASENGFSLRGTGHE